MEAERNLFSIITAQLMLGRAINGPVQIEIMDGDATETTYRVYHKKGYIYESTCRHKPHIFAPKGFMYSLKDLSEVHDGFEPIQNAEHAIKIVTNKI